uniref:Uncharacterized protein n=1 Tax=Arundo donax TaxID=35708 RepID=A0A0A8Z150_ARUDO
MLLQCPTLAGLFTMAKRFAAA